MSYDYLYLFIDYALSNLFTQHVSRCWLCTVSQCTFVIMGYNLVLASSWCQIVYFKNLFLSSLILLRNGSVLDTNIWISIFKWIGNDNSKLNINCAVEQTLRHSLIPLFFGTPCMYVQLYFYQDKEGKTSWKLASKGSNKKIVLKMWKKSKNGGGRSAMKIRSPQFKT